MSEGHTSHGGIGARPPIQQITELEQAFVGRLRRRERVARNVNELHDEQLTFGQRLADGFATVMGSWRFIIIQSCILVGWIALNVVGWIQHWDPYPFILLNLMLSFQAAYAAPIIMMSQNRQAAKDRLQADHDYEVNLKAEIEIEELHRKLDTLRQQQWAELLDLQQRQLALLEQLSLLPGGPMPNTDSAGSSPDKGR
jgi:uncharacterized membrane protein